ncbi:MAG: peroxidase [Deltaproteobacteria bacterium]|nr:peroxidase [Deltaproteobacteria bacterium]
MSALQEDYRKADLNPADRAMLDYVAKLTREPWNMVEEDVSTLREHGFQDQGVLDINQVAAYYAFVNRIADGLGVQLESYWES